MTSSRSQSTLSRAIGASWSPGNAGIARLPLRERRSRLAALLKNPPLVIAYSDHQGCDGEVFRRAACEHGLKGIVSKRLDRA
jgi:ATP-dependent DNA ligase